MNRVSESDVRQMLRDLADDAPRFPGVSAVSVHPSKLAHRGAGWLLAATVAVAAGVVPAVVMWTTSGSSLGGEAPAFSESGGTTPTSPSAGPELASNDEVRAVAARLDLYKEPGYGKVTVDLEAREVRVYWNGTPPKAISDAAGVQPSGVRVVLFQTSYSANELAAAGEEALAEGRTPGAVPINSVGPLADLSGIRVDISPDNMPADVDALRRQLEQVAGVPVTIEEGGEVIGLVPGTPQGQ